MRDQPPPLSRGPRLRRGGGASVGLSLALRLGLALALIGVALTVHWVDRGGLRDNIDGHISFPDVVYFTMITISTVGYGDIVPVTERARMFDAFGLTPIRLFVWLIFVGTAYDFFLRGLWERWRMAVIQKTLRGHYVVAGYGTSGAEAVSELIRRGVAREAIVVIEPAGPALRHAEACGVTTMEGDATRNAVLEGAQIGRAAALIASAGRDDTSILIVLTARRLAPHVPISVVIRSEDNESLARQAGATTVINPASFAGLLLAGSTHGPHMADYLVDLSSAHGAVALRERCVEPDEVGRALSALGTGTGLRLYRDGAAFEVWQAEAASLRPGDLIVEVVRAPS